MFDTGSTFIKKMPEIAPCNFLNKKSIMNYGKWSYGIFVQTFSN